MILRFSAVTLPGLVSHIGVVMPRFRRLVVPNYPHHVTQRGVRRQTTFFDEGDYIQYLELAVELLTDCDIKFWAYCLMPNHVHAIVVPRSAEALAGFFAPLHRRYARRTNEKLEWRGHLWQERFFSVVMDESHALAAMRYVELNPVRAGLCNRPEDWPWSSARGNLGLAFDPLVNRNETRTIVTNWREYLGTQESNDELETLRRQTRTGRPEGSTRFVERLEALSGRRIRKAKPGKRRNKVTGPGTALKK